MSLIGNLFVNVRANTSGLTRGLAKSKKSVSNFGRSMKTAGRNLTLGLTAPIVALGVSSVKTAATFEKSMSRVLALTEATDKEFVSLNKTALKLGKTTVFTASQAAEGMSAFALAGFNANKIIAAMPATLNLAAAGQLGIADAAAITAKIMSGMGIQADQLENSVNVLTKAFTTAQTDLIDLGEGLKFVGPVARSVGLSFEETVSVLQALADGALAGGEGGTKLRMILLRLAGATPEATKKLDALGIKTADAGGNLLSIANIVDQLNRSMKNLAPTAKTALLGQIFDARQVAAMNILLSKGAFELQEMSNALFGLGNVAENIADIQLDNLFGSVTRLKSAFEGLSISFGDALIGPIDTIVNKLRDLTLWFGKLSVNTKEWILIISGIAAIIGPAIISIGFLASGISAIVATVKGIGLVAGAIGGLNLAIGFAVIGAITLASKIDAMITRGKRLVPMLKDLNISGFGADIERSGFLAKSGAVQNIATVQGRESAGFKAKASAVRQERINRGLPVADGPTIQERLLAEQLNELKQMRMEQKQGFENQERALNDLGGGA